MFSQDFDSRFLNHMMPWKLVVSLCRSSSMSEPRNARLKELISISKGLADFKRMRNGGLFMYSDRRKRAAWMRMKTAKRARWAPVNGKRARPRDGLKAPQPRPHKTALELKEPIKYGRHYLTKSRFPLVSASRLSNILSSSQSHHLSSSSFSIVSSSNLFLTARHGLPTAIE